ATCAVRPPLQATGASTCRATRAPRLSALEPAALRCENSRLIALRHPSSDNWPTRARLPTAPGSECDLPAGPRVSLLHVPDCSNRYTARRTREVPRRPHRPWPARTLRQTFPSTAYG